MRIVPVSDLHIDHMRPDTLEQMIAAIPRDIDVLVVAGDVATSGKRVAGLFDTLCGEFSEVIYVIGNHEYYNNTVEDLHETVAGIVDSHQNLHWLDNSVVTINQQRFLGSTLWFPFQESNKKYERPMADFGQIPQFCDWVYEENRRSQDFLRASTTGTDVVITHFMPTYRSVAPQYAASPFNRFFVSPMDDLIDEAQPRLWIHGHTHIACLHQMGSTRVACNPFGYESIGEEARFCPWLILETKT